MHESMSLMTSDQWIYKINVKYIIYTYNLYKHYKSINYIILYLFYMHFDIPIGYILLYIYINNFQIFTKSI